MQPGMITGPVDALRADAAIWRDIGDELDAAAAVAATLDLTAAHFSIYADWTGITDLYRDIQDRMVALMREGARVHRDMADGLLRIADDFQAADDGAESAITID